MYIDYRVISWKQQKCSNKDERLWKNIVGNVKICLSHGRFSRTFKTQLIFVGIITVRKGAPDIITSQILGLNTQSRL
jgi:hypothetical protein